MKTIFSGYTPGPWYTSDDGVGVTVRESEGCSQIVVVNPYRRNYEANARLIAAAPELHEVLREILFRVEFGPDDHALEERGLELIRRL